ncbi:hypothetical protein QQ045_004346 [Rhodiola kirilowii]
MLYHGLIVIGTSAILLLIYNLIIVRWCVNRHSTTRPTAQSSVEAVKRCNSNQGISVMLPSYKYNKESQSQHHEHGDDQCAVCLSVFEDGEDLKHLPRCKHSFHAQCIDMWLYSHLDCPICRAMVQPPVPAAPQQLQKPNEASTPAARRDMSDVDPENMV